MPVDPEYLRQHYASLSDEALQEIDRADLVETARQCYDYELRQRDLSSRLASAGPRLSKAPQTADEEVAVYAEADDAGPKPEWLDDASEVFSRVDRAGATPASDIVDARNTLEAAGVPCYLDLSDAPEEASVSPRPTRLWRLMVPGNLNLRATSVLERDIFNADFEAEWKTHLEMLSDEELRAMNPRSVFCGLFDRVERVTRSYDEEIARRDRTKFESA
jgi:hypothetical protein